MEYRTYNPQTRKYESIDIDEAELIPGMTLIAMYWSLYANKWVTVPGASLYIVNNDLNLEPVE